MISHSALANRPHLCHVQNVSFMEEKAEQMQTNLPEERQPKLLRVGVRGNDVDDGLELHSRSAEKHCLLDTGALVVVADAKRQTTLLEQRSSRLL